MPVPIKEEINPARQLAAIMFTDMVGYTALMGKDTSMALDLIRRSKEIQKPLVDKHHGKWLKEMGDGALAVFNTALDAVNCAVEIQEMARERLDGKLRIGIHLGDVTIDNQDVYGDGVNIASRLESITDPGGIYISESIEKAIRGQSDVQAKFLGEIHLKNVGYAVRTYALQGVGLPVPDLNEKKHLSGRIIAEMGRRGMLRAAATYIMLALLLILLFPYVVSFIKLPIWAMLILLTVGFAVAMYLAWNYERSPEGFVRTSSQQSWQNPYPVNQRKPLTGNLLILGLFAAVLIIYFNLGRNESNTTAAPSLNEKSIAVLSFTDMSPEKDQEYLGDGIAEDIITTLSGIKDLKVIGRTSSFQFKGRNVDLKEIGKKLNVASVLEGSIQRSGNMVRITVQLINVADNFHIWSERYDREIDDIFTIQDEISNNIAEKLKVTLLNSPGLRTENTPTRNMEAYELVLQGNYVLRQGEESGDKASVFFKKAIELDSGYADAYFGLAWSYFFGGKRDELKNITKTIESFDFKDTRVNELAMINNLFVEWDWEKTRIEHEKWLQYNAPGNITQAYYLAYLYGRLDEAIKEANLAVEKDPLHPDALRNQAIFYIFDRQYEKGRKILNYILEIYPDYGAAYERIGYSYMIEEKYDLAIENYKKADALFEGIATTRVDMVICFARSGRKREALELFSEVLEEEIQEGINITSVYWIGFSSVVKAQAYFALGDRDEAFRWLNLAYDAKEATMLELKINRFYDPYRSDPRFQEIVKRMNFPD